MRTAWFAILGALALAGCRLAKPPASTDTIPLTAVKASSTTHATDPHDPTPTVPLVVHLTVYRMALPVGTVSRNEEFWKHLNEDCVDVATHDLLYKNGLRVGQAPATEWEYFSKLIEHSPAKTQTVSYLATEMNAAEMPMNRFGPTQTIFDFNAANVLTGRTYEESTNILTLSFQPSPRRIGQVHIAICPLVRNVRKEYVVKSTGAEREIEYVSPERYYELNMRADVPIDNLLILAPSPEARWKSSVGHAFLITPSPAEELEVVLIFVPKLFRMDPKQMPSPSSPFIHEAPAGGS